MVRRWTTRCSVRPRAITRSGRSTPPRTSRNSSSPGPTRLSVLLDPGWYHEVGGFGAGFSYGRPGLKAVVALDYADGKTEWLTTGPGWQWKEGAIRSANIYRGERVDFRKDHDEWKSPDAGSGWKPAQVIPPVSPKTIPMDLNPIRRGQQLKPVKHWQIGPKTWLFDVGEMIHGWVRFAMDEPAGATVRLRYSEKPRSRTKPRGNKSGDCPSNWSVMLTHAALQRTLVWLDSQHRRRHDVDGYLYQGMCSKCSIGTIGRL